MSIKIRRAVVEDTEKISYLGKKTFGESFGHLFRDPDDLLVYLAVTFSIEKLKSSIQKTNNVYWLVLDNNIPVGYAKLQLNVSSPFISNRVACKLQRIYFVKTHSSQGIGRRLQEVIFQEAMANNFECIWLSVLKENTGAIKFYERSDYTIVGEHPFSIGKENFEFWVMSRKL